MHVPSPFPPRDCTNNPNSSSLDVDAEVIKHLSPGRVRREGRGGRIEEMKGPYRGHGWGDSGFRADHRES